jgi:hypothetical protein
MLRRVVRYKFTDVSEEHTAYIFRIEEQAKQAIKALFVCYFLLDSCLSQEPGWLSRYGDGLDGRGSIPCRGKRLFSPPHTV